MVVDPSRYLQHFRLICHLKADKVTIMPKCKTQWRESKKKRKEENRRMGTGKNVRKLNERGKKGGGSMGNGHQHLFMKHSTTTRKTQHSLQSVNYDDVYFIFSLTLLDV